MCEIRSGPGVNVQNVYVGVSVCVPVCVHTRADRVCTLWRSPGQVAALAVKAEALVRMCEALLEFGVMDSERKWREDKPCC